MVNKVQRLGFFGTILKKGSENREMKTLKWIYYIRPGTSPPDFLEGS